MAKLSSFWKTTTQADLKKKKPSTLDNFFLDISKNANLYPDKPKPGTVGVQKPTGTYQTSKGGKLINQNVGGTQPQTETKVLDFKPEKTIGDPTMPVPQQIGEYESSMERPARNLFASTEAGQAEFNKATVDWARRKKASDDATEQITKQQPAGVTGATGDWVTDAVTSTPTTLETQAEQDYNDALLNLQTSFDIQKERMELEEEGIDTRESAEVEAIKDRYSNEVAGLAIMGYDEAYQRKVETEGVAAVAEARAGFDKMRSEMNLDLQEMENEMNIREADLDAGYRAELAGYIAEERKYSIDLLSEQTKAWNAENDAMMDEKRFQLDVYKAETSEERLGAKLEFDITKYNNTLMENGKATLTDDIWKIYKETGGNAAAGALAELYAEKGIDFDAATLLNAKKGESGLMAALSSDPVLFTAFTKMTGTEQDLVKEIANNDLKQAISNLNQYAVTESITSKSVTGSAVDDKKIGEYMTRSLESNVPPTIYQRDYSSIYGTSTRVSALDSYTKAWELKKESLMENWILLDDGYAYVEYREMIKAEEFEKQYIEEKTYHIEEDKDVRKTGTYTISE